MQTTIRYFVACEGTFTLICTSSDLINLYENLSTIDCTIEWNYTKDTYIVPKNLNSESFEKWRACILLAEAYYDVYGDESVFPRCKAIVVTIKPQEADLSFVDYALNVLVGEDNVGI